MTRRPRFHVGPVVASAGLLLAAGSLVDSLRARATGPVAPQPSSPEPSSAPTVSRTTMVDGVEFTVQRSESAEGPCVDVVATVEGIAQGGVGGGLSGDCGRPQDADLGWGLGGLLVGDEWFNIAYGAASPAVATVSVTVGDGTEVADDVAGAGVWLVVVPAEPLDARSDFSQIRALDATGGVVAEVKPPSLVAYRQQAQAVGTGAAPNG